MFLVWARKTANSADNHVSSLFPELTHNKAVHRIEARLEAVETSLQKIESSVVFIHKFLQANSSIAPLWSGSPLDGLSDTPASTSLQRSRHQEGRLGNRHINLTRDNGQQWEVGPTGLPSLLLDAQEFILDPIDASMEQDAEVRKAAAVARERLDVLFSTLKNPDLLSDDLSPLEVPPLSIVEAMMEPFFNFIQPRMPIWTRRRFERYIESCHTASDADPGKRAALTCANNMVILTLATKFVKVTAKRAGREAKTLSSMELGLLNTFLLNAKRALNRIEQLLVPTLANIQAILSLCLVAQLFLSDDIFQRMFQQAVYLARLAGIENSEVSSNTPLDSHEAEERNNILSCLHLIAPSVGWRGGTCLDLVSTLPLRASSFEFPTNSDDEHGILPLADLAQYELAVCTQAYSAKPNLPWPPAFAQPGSALQQHTETWWRKFGERLDMGKFVDSEENSSTMSSASSVLLERTLCFHTLRILMTWQLPQSQRNVREQLEDSRLTLRLLSLAANTESDLGHFASIIRFLVSYPPFAFFVLMTSLIKGDHQPDTSISDHGRSISSSSGNSTAQLRGPSDLELLESFCQLVQSVSDILGEYKPHIFKLNVFIKTLTDLAIVYCRSNPNGTASWPADSRNAWDKISIEPLQQNMALANQAGQQQHFVDQLASTVEFDEIRLLSSAALPGLDFSLDQSSHNSMDPNW
ncbi:hypothetical protein HJFPF1_08462 [Paramyrothecium foliicola]|nr:hypothetical protein HJFPF1_08462 [Paramyrothecium foliicola]